MKLFGFSKSMSRTVHEEHEAEDNYEIELKNNNIGGGGGACTCLTVWRKSLVMSCNGFTVFDSCGNLVYRVDNYMGRPEQVILMDAAGKSLLTMSRRKKLGLVCEWLVYEGEDENENECCSAKTECATINDKPIYCVKKSTNMLLPTRNGRNELAYVFRRCCDRRYAYVIEGSYANRSCKVSDEKGIVVAEIKRKESAAAGAGVSYGADVFLLVVFPSFNPVFAMALVLLLDQMF